ncbi:ARMC10 isoform 10 [Pan troglodytes]|uniref:ARMC10 isoform 10 n=1 Tax=Pan troglodytes TaxID=9598 RepID=A0A2J8IQJ4_PANTR|nr:ARMC10 isoform 10 [Pan troglodytes]
MGGPRGAGWVAAGLLLGAGACYCIYRLTRGRRRGDRELGIRSSKSADEKTETPKNSKCSLDGCTSFLKGETKCYQHLRRLN